MSGKVGVVFKVGCTPFSMLCKFPFVGLGDKTLGSRAEERTKRGAGLNPDNGTIGSREYLVLTVDPDPLHKG